MYLAQENYQEMLTQIQVLIIRNCIALNTILSLNQIGEMRALIRLILELILLQD